MDPLFAHAAEDGFVLKFNDQTFELSQEEILKSQGVFYLPGNSNVVSSTPSRDELVQSFFYKATAKPAVKLQQFSHDPEAVYKFIKSAANAVEKPVQEPAIKIEDNRAVEFTPPADGVQIKSVDSSLSMLRGLEEGQKQSELAYATTSPKTSLASLNDLGINELVARGTSNFKGSPKNRRHNIKIGVEKFQGLIIKKGEEFSFNKYLGPVEAEQGFLPELVIKASGTIPELGGGLCQVSSTTFRAAMEAGLKITQRKNHAYAVQYYAPQGTDATIYPGVVDLKFVNDTPGDILVWPHFVGNDDLIFDFYGTKDNRQVTLSKPRQYDRKSDGSMKAEWIQTVTKDGVTSTSTFKSVYQPPALFHKEEQFVAAAPTTPPPADGTQSPTVN
jgi:vancomycin resistance protein YoaR